LLDAFYFSVITLTTVGYGDLSPTTPISKIFTVIYILLGISILLAFINKLASKADRSVADVTNGEQETDSEER
jgi:voltage-gated potassium channel